MVNPMSMVGEREFIILDLETTGFSPEYCHILEIAALKIIDGEIRESFHTLIRQGSPVPPFIRHLTGITDDDVSQGQDIHAALTEFLSFVGERTLVGHNVDFDYAFLNRNIERHLKLLPSNHRIDTVRLTKQLISDVENYKLGTLADYFKIPKSGHHRALNDTHITYQLLRSLSDLNDNYRERHSELIHSSVNGCDLLRRKRIVVKTKLKYVQSRLLECIFHEMQSNVAYQLHPECDVLIVNETAHRQLQQGDVFDDLWDDWLMKARDRQASGRLTVLNERQLCELLKLPVVEKKRSPRFHTTQAEDIVAETDNFDESHPLYQKRCVFTGVLDRYDRKSAMQFVANVGGLCQNNVVKTTDFLILGDNSYCSLITGGKSSKQKKAEKMILEGSEIKIIPESVFYQLLRNEWGES